MENRDAAFLEIAARLFAENAAELMEAIHGIRFQGCMKIFCKVKEMLYFGNLSASSGRQLFNSVSDRLARKIMRIVRT